ncbi:dTMP kinase [Corynebacterium uberis]|uniref:dTMP kinase n=1 Tax=Corynebacterium TaxID=1716 RepID=UPI001D09A4D6|nr:MULTISPECIES: dTMP kinase [Corynebacterium]MCZ9309231.1 dTMP kinase [Corynebacterium sp. c6VSa_13]UDL72788.1 dTMP kinase [Corynebacterium uberis]UDL76335.1 dTMP kinase [Corynebacterium uberis]UDL78547.1 dTMP kinase [Corynebacterium uberis]UDL80828.1 dTMP kinase [Corynebacterium uberis]
MLIAIEGIDGAGKNTLVHALIPLLTQAGCATVSVLSFPRYAESQAAQLAAAALHGSVPGVGESPLAMAALFALDRAGVADSLHAAAAAPGQVLLLDRYVASNAAYTAARIADLPAARSTIEEMEFGQLGLPPADLTVLLDTPPETASQRARNREHHDESRTRDRYERDSQLQQATYDAYQQLAQQQWQGPWLVTSNAAAIVDKAQHVAPAAFCDAKGHK